MRCTVILECKIPRTRPEILEEVIIESLQVKASGTGILQMLSRHNKEEGIGSATSFELNLYGRCNLGCKKDSWNTRSAFLSYLAKELRSPSGPTPTISQSTATVEDTSVLLPLASGFLEASASTGVSPFKCLSFLGLDPINCFICIQFELPPPPKVRLSTSTIDVICDSMYQCCITFSKNIKNTYLDFATGFNLGRGPGRPPWRYKLSSFCHQRLEEARA